MARHPFTYDNLQRHLRGELRRLGCAQCEGVALLEYRDGYTGALKVSCAMCDWSQWAMIQSGVTVEPMETPRFGARHDGENDPTQALKENSTHRSKRCRVPGCDKRFHEGGLCEVHHRQWRMAGKPGDRDGWVQDIAPKAKAKDPPMKQCVCRVESCDKQARTKHLCPTHYANWFKCGKPDLQAWLDKGAPVPTQWFGGLATSKPKPKRTARARVIQRPCRVEGCSEPCRSRGMCKKHYTRWFKCGQPDLAQWLAKGAPSRIGWCGARPRKAPPCLTRPCRVQGCCRTIGGRKHRGSRGMCVIHYRRWRDCGQPDIKTFVRSGAPALSKWRGRDLRFKHKQLGAA